MWYVDFILFRRYLGIKQMMNVERSLEYKKRVRFNKPYGTIDIFIGEISDYIPLMSRDRKHILWLDFDDIIKREALDAIALAAAQLSAGSILLVTLDVEPPGGPKDGPKQWFKHFKGEASNYLGTVSQWQGRLHFNGNPVSKIETSIQIFRDSCIPFGQVIDKQTPAFG
jgi:hypothetical protein